MDWSKQQQELQRLIEESTGMKHVRLTDESIRKFIEPLRSPHLGALGGMLEDMRRQNERTQEMLRTVTGYPSTTTALVEAMRQIAPVSITSLFEKMALRDEVFQDYLRDTERARKASLGILESVRSQLLGTPNIAETMRTSLLTEMTGITAATEALAAPSTAVLAAAVDGWRTVFSLQGRGAGGALTNPLLEVARTLRRSSEFLARHDDPIATYAVETAMTLTDLELRISGDTVSGIDAEDEVTEDAPERRLFVPRRQRFEAQRDASALEGLALNEVLAVLPVGQIVLMAREVIGGVTEINETRQAAGKTGIFKITQRVVRVVAELPFALAVDRHTLADVVDDLYWLLYESAGSDKLRYLKAAGGPVEPTECDVVFFVKRLRNHLRHDPEHGSEREIEKKFAALREDLVKRGFSGLPRTRVEFGRLHRVILEETAAFLRSLRDRL